MVQDGYPMMDYLAEHQIEIESCPTSHLHTKMVVSEEIHSLPQFLHVKIEVSLIRMLPQ
ncbi:hypothetical protein [Celerinatantimonas yamalensis]|uniref:Adenosine deaminase domain-containing protein n=1 Tax=Celerinatantimonas yamalensis TaxID=559956 RepID=A0ABW9G7S3_9GAMM